jgi:hypothetical protein
MRHISHKYSTLTDCLTQVFDTRSVTLHEAHLYRTDDIYNRWKGYMGLNMIRTVYREKVCRPAPNSPTDCCRQHPHLLDLPGKKYLLEFRSRPSHRRGLLPQFPAARAATASHELSSTPESVIRPGREERRTEGNGWYRGHLETSRRPNKK